MLSFWIYIDGSGTAKSKMIEQDGKFLDFVGLSWHSII